MANLDEVAGRPIVTKIKGKEYKLSLLNIDDLADFEKMVKQERLENAIESLKKAGASPETIGAAFGNISTRELSGTELKAAMSSMSGTRYLFWCALKGNQDVKLSQMGDLIDLDNLEEMIKIIEVLGGEAARKAKNLRKGKAK